MTEMTDGAVRREVRAYSNRRATARGTIKTGLGTLVSVVAGLALHVFLARALQPALYGLLAVVSSLIMWWELSGAALLRHATEWAVARADGSCAGAAGASLRVGLAWSLVLMIACEAAAPAIASALGDPMLVGYVRLMALDIPLWVLWSSHLAILNGRRCYGGRALSC
ncbi:unnamed protein product, partial [marine sediment metagenome]